MITNDNLSFLKIQKQSENADLHSEFKRIAEILFEQFVLVINGSLRFTLVEIEFYLLSLWHQDYFIYGYPEQKEFGEWIKHPAGMDLTFGNNDKGVYAGILLRSIREADGDKQFINGSINVRDALSNKNSKVTTEELRSTVGLYKNERPSSKTIFVSKRIGLTDKSFNEHYKQILDKDLIFNDQVNPNPDIFKKRYYRFITDVCPKNKFKEKIRVAENTYEECGYLPDFINDLYGWKVLKK